MAIVGHESSPANSENTSENVSSQSITKISGGDVCGNCLPAFLSHTYNVIAKNFSLIQQYETTLAARPAAFLQHTGLSRRDRYSNIQPWAHNTVQLHSRKFPDNYINASPITLGRFQESFIATQGPGPGNTILHFWQMVWQEGVEVIVMLTQCVEAGIEKCGVYIPKNKGENILLRAESKSTWGKVQCVTQSSEEWGEIRQLRVLREGDGDLNGERIVHHFQFTRWPDQQVPFGKKDQMALISLINLSRLKMSRINDSPGSSPSPRIVHCSAGVGRTGTFIALDHLLHELEDGNLDHLMDHEDPIFNTVKRLREQRMGLVNNLQQFALIYQILREKWLQRHPHVERHTSMWKEDDAKGSVGGRNITDTWRKGLQKLSRSNMSV